MSKSRWSEENERAQFKPKSPKKQRYCTKQTESRFSTQSPYAELCFNAKAKERVSFIQLSRGRDRSSHEYSSDVAIGCEEE